MNHFDPELFDSLIDAAEVASSTGGGLANSAEWLVKNTRHPKDWNKPYSFKDHEWQIDVLNDTDSHVYIRKATQITASEVGVRQALATAAKLKNITAIYTMPSLGASAKLVASRVDPVINSSPRLKALVDRNVDSTSIKKIGHSFVYFSGAANTNSAISVPARALFIDEYSFSNPEVISTYTSRLGHNFPGTEIVRIWSSPLHPHSDISELYEKGDQRVYMVYHSKCGQWVELDPMQCLVLPGYDDEIANIMPSDLDQPKVLLDKAWIMCPHCRGEITQENLCLASHRAWVPKRTGQWAHSYDANCFVLPAYRTPIRIFEDLRVYRNTVRWSQYALGVPSSSASEQILEHVINSCFTVKPISDTEKSVYGACIGVDIGNTSHLMVGKRVNGILEVFKAEKIVQDGDNKLKKTIIDRFNSYMAVSCCIDAAPDVSIVSSVQAELAYNSVNGVFFTRGKGKSDLTIFELDEVKGVIKVARTRAFDEFVADFNSGKIKLLAGSPYEEEMKKHFQAIKRIVNTDAVGESVHVWVSSTSDDHWTFSLLYLWLASRLAEDSLKVFIAPASSLLVSRVKMRSMAA
jgi:hypothetical protein